MQEVAKLGWLPVAAAPWSGSESSVDAKALAAAAEGSRPALDTCSYTCAAQQRWCAACAAARQKANECSGLGAPPATKLEGEDNEAAARGAEKFGVRSLFGKAGVPTGSPAEPACMGARPRLSRGDTTVVSTASWTPPHNGKPFAMTSRRRSSWRSTTTLRSSQEGIGGNGSAGFTADPGCGPLKRDIPGAQKSNTWASSAVVAALIKPGAAAAPGRVEGAWQPQSPEEQDPERGGLEAELGGCGERGEHTGSKWASLQLATRGSPAKRCR